MSKTITKSKKVYYFNSSDEYTPYSFSRTLASLIEENCRMDRHPVILCIGTDRSTGDSLGPLIGYKLSNKNISNITIYGTLNNPVHAVNLEETMDLIKREQPNAFIIAIDASLGKSDHIGYITLGLGPLKPGLGVKKELPEVGDICITGIVNLSGLLDSLLLQSTRLATVMNLADCITKGIVHAMLKVRYRSVTYVD